MRHKKKKLTLGRTKASREALFRIQVINLITNKQIVTTKVKAKALRSRAEKLITRAAKKDANTKQYLKKVLGNDDAVKTLVADIAPKYVDRPGGYTRISKMGRRSGDAAEMVKIELI